MTDSRHQLPQEPVAQTFGQRVAGIIRDAIIRGELTSGAYLRQEELSERFRISRIPLRDALLQLEKEGFVVVLPYRGAVVAPVSAQEAREILELMTVLHPLALRLAYPNLTPEVLDLADQILDVRENSTDAGQWERFTKEFLMTLLQPSGRPLLLSIVKDLHDQIGRYAHVYLVPWRDQKALRSIYRAVVQACRKGDLEKAVETLQAGYEKAREALVGRIQESESANEQAAEPAPSSRGRKPTKKRQE